MTLRSKVLLLCADDDLRVLASAAFMRMLGNQHPSRVPEFAGQRVRQASIVVEAIGGFPVRVVHRTFSILHFDEVGKLDVDRLMIQQLARLEAATEARFNALMGASIVAAENRFVARGGEWKPKDGLLARIDAAAMGALACQKVRVER